MNITPDHSPEEAGASPADAAETQQTPDQIMEAAAARIATLEAERDDMRDRWMRAEAEMANIRARAKRDVDDTRQFAVQKFARDVAEAAENIKRGLDAIPAQREDEPDLVTKLRDGFAGVERSFVALLERNGVVRTDPTGALFNPDLHQAMAEHETGDHPPGTVVQAWTQGWTLNGRILRPAMVVVAKAPAAQAAATRIDTTA
jgi:molecular chaperone GrpE